MSSPQGHQSDCGAYLPSGEEIAQRTAEIRAANEVAKRDKPASAGEAAKRRRSVKSATRVLLRNGRSKGPCDD